MKTAPYAIRHATIETIKANPHLIESSRNLFSPAVWNCLPGLLDELLKSRRVRIAAVSDDKGRVRILGGCSFVSSHLFYRALDDETETLHQALFRMAAESEMPFLSPKQIAPLNAKSALISFDFVGVPDIDFGRPMDPETGNLFAVINQAYSLFHQGYRTQELWQEWAVPSGREFTRTMGFTEVRERPCSDGSLSWVFRLRESEVRSRLGFALAASMVSVPPVLGFSLAEQEVLEQALLGLADPEICTYLALDENALKKRWRAIYMRLQKREPELAPDNLAPPARRRRLLDGLRSRLQELRPWPRNGERLTSIG